MQANVTVIVVLVCAMTLKLHWALYLYGSLQSELSAMWSFVALHSRGCYFQEGVIIQCLQCMDMKIGEI